MSEKLKPCPFCGAKVYGPERINRYGRPIWEIGCVLFCTFRKGSTKKEAIELWNQRMGDNP